MKSNDNQESALRSAALHKKQALVAKLLSEGVDPNAASSFGNTPILYAALHGSASIVSILLANGADPNKANLRIYCIDCSC